MNTKLNNKNNNDLMIKSKTEEKGKKGLINKNKY
jgi:hypothetical protein